MTFEEMFTLRAPDEDEKVENTYKELFDAIDDITQEMLNKNINSLETYEKGKETVKGLGDKVYRAKRALDVKGKVNRKVKDIKFRLARKLERVFNS